MWGWLQRGVYDRGGNPPVKVRVTKKGDFFPEGLDRWMYARTERVLLEARQGERRQLLNAFMPQNSHMIETARKQEVENERTMEKEVRSGTGIDGTSWVIYPHAGDARGTPFLRMAGSLFFLLHEIGHVRTETRAIFTDPSDGRWWSTYAVFGSPENSSPAWIEKYRRMVFTPEIAAWKEAIRLYRACRDAGGVDLEPTLNEDRLLAIANASLETYNRIAQWNVRLEKSEFEQ